jgi:hypothetical protein
MTGRICGVWRAFHLHARRGRRQRRQMAPESDAGLRPSMLASLPTRSRSPWEAAAVAAISQAAATEEMTSLNTLPTLWVGSAVRADEVIAQKRDRPRQSSLPRSSYLDEEPGGGRVIRAFALRSLAAQES